MGASRTSHVDERDRDKLSAARAAWGTRPHYFLVRFADCPEPCVMNIDELFDAHAKGLVPIEHVYLPVSNLERELLGLVADLVAEGTSAGEAT